jgi:hypothetical protein
MLEDGVKAMTASLRSRALAEVVELDMKLESQPRKQTTR